MANIVNLSDLFISYAHANDDFVMQLWDELKSRDLEIWIDKEDIPKASKWRDDIRAGIEGANTFLFVISPESVLSEECLKEVIIADELEKRIVPLLYQPLETDAQKSAMHDSISQHNWIIFDGDWTATIDEIIATISTNLEHVRLHTRLLVTARQWEMAQRDQSILLRGAALQEAETWLDTAHTQEPPPSDLHSEFIRSSRSAQNRRQQMQIWATSAVTIVTTVLAILSFFLYRVSVQNERDAISARDAAQRSAEVANSAALAAEAQLALMEDDVSQAISLAWSANQIEQPLPEVQRALIQALTAPGPRRVFEDHGEQVNAVAFLPDGRFLSAGRDNTLRLTDINTGQTQTFSGHEDWITSIAVLPDGERIVTGAQDGRLIVWDLATGSALQTITAYDVAVLDVVSGADGTIISAGCDSGVVPACSLTSVRVWDVATGAPVAVLFDQHRSMIWALEYGPQSGDVYIGSASGLIYGVNSRGEQRVVHDVHIDQSGRRLIFDVALSDDGRLLASVGDDRRVVIWDVVANALVQVVEDHSSRIQAVTFSPDGAYLATGSEDQSILVYDTDRWTVLRRFVGHTAEINALTFDAQSRYIISGATDTTTRLWDMVSLSQQEKWEVVDGNLNAMTRLSAIEIVAGDHLGRLAFLELTDRGYVLQERVEAHADMVNQITVSPDGTFFVVAASDGTLSIWDSASRSLRQRLFGHESRVWDVAISPDGRQIASGASDSGIILWDATTGAIEARLNEHFAAVLGLTYTLDGSKLISASSDSSLIVWDIASASADRRLVGQGDWVWDVTMHPSGTMALSAGENGTVIIWDWQAGTIIEQISAHNAPVTRVLYADDGQYAFTASRDRTVRVWDMEARRLLYTLSGHRDAVWALHFDTDILTTSGFDGSLRDWVIRFTADEWIADASALRDALGLADEQPSQAASTRPEDES